MALLCATGTHRNQVRLMFHRSFLALIALLSSIAIAEADEHVGFHRMLIAMEQRAIAAVRARSASELQSIHNDIMYDVVGSGAGRWKPDAQCWPAYVHLWIPVLLYASAIDPTISTPVRSPDENASMGDKVWAEYLQMMEACERATGVVAQNQSRPSVLLRRVFPNGEPAERRR